MNPAPNTLRVILQLLTTAPVGELHPDWTQRAQKLYESSAGDAEIHALFAEIYALPDEVASRFVKAVIDPRFTKDY